MNSATVAWLQCKEMSQEKFNMAFSTASCGSNFGGIIEPLWRNGPIPGALHSFPGGMNSSQNLPHKHTLNPVTTGASVVATKFDGGIVLAADTLGSYGSLARYRSVSRIMKVNENTVIGGSGDYADFQHLKSVLEQKVIDDECLNDGHGYTPQSIYSWLTRMMYYRRTKFNPLWNHIVVAGFYSGQSFLGCVDKIGIAFESPTVATGYGAYIAQPLLRDAFEKNPNMTEAEAKNLVVDCLKVLFYRDGRSFNKYEIAIVTKDGAVVEKPAVLDTNWSIAPMVKGYE